MTVFLPGIVLAGLGESSAFVIWLAVLTLVGWWIAAAPSVPVHIPMASLGTMKARLSLYMRDCLTRLTGFATMPRRIAALEQRVAELEAQLASQSQIREMPANPAADTLAVAEA